MIKRLLSIFTFLLPLLLSGQIQKPAKWSFSVQKGTGNEHTLVFSVKLDPEWHLYSQYTPDGGPIPMEFTFEPSDCYERIGKVTEPTPHEDYDSTFMVKVLQFEKSAVFKQKIRLKKNPCTIKGRLNYQGSLHLRGRGVLLHGRCRNSHDACNGQRYLLIRHRHGYADVRTN
jgi:thiol:disulfide interchange protein DsbD